MNVIYEFFNGLADKIPLTFLHGNFSLYGYDFSRLFALAVALLLLVIIIIIAVSVSRGKKKRKKAATPIPVTDNVAKTVDNDSPLSEKQAKAANYSQNTLLKAVATPTFELEMMSEEEQLSAAEQIVDIHQVIIDDMNEADKATMLDEFDFDIEIDALCDFDTDLTETDDDEDEIEEEIEQVLAQPQVELKKSLPATIKKADVRYERSFAAKLVQTTSNNKARYNVIKNMFNNYHKVRNTVSWNNESFISGKNLIARIYLIGKTLRLCLALNPADYDASIYHQEDKSDTSKYKSVPMMIKIKSRLGLKRAVSLVMDLADNFGLKKSNRIEIVDYIAANVYQPDKELLRRGLLRLEDPNRFKIAPTTNNTQVAAKGAKVNAQPATINKTAIKIAPSSDKNQESTKATVTSKAAKSADTTKSVTPVKAAETKKPVAAAKTTETTKSAKAPAKQAIPVKRAQIAAADATEKAEKYGGKYVFVKKVDGIHFALIANNGQLLLESMTGYTSPAGAKRGIDTFKKAVSEGEFLVDDDKFGRHRFILKSKNSISSYSGEAYKTKVAAESSAQSVKRFALTAAIIPFEEE
ncbi:MAG: DUF1508 domain-containing protein [Clostridia bacterium]|nr:DUF1508 domain-containing protein [Clostridia bacterium]